MPTNDDILHEILILLRSAGLSRCDRARALSDLIYVLDARIERLTKLSDAFFETILFDDDL